MFATPKISTIDKISVHNICSGQVIVTLATAIKELVENSIDAGTKSIQVTFREYGIETIEVSDNGKGIAKKNFSGLVLKHHTSKIKQYDDISNVSTFGFRGEALSSLCALGNMTVLTSTGCVGTFISYDKNGVILKMTNQARPQGTTVTIENLFHTLPVRHKEFVKNIKKEYQKAIDGLQAYAMIAFRIRIHCVNITKKRKQVIFSTQGKATLKENIIDILGSSIFKALIPISFTDNVFNVNGYISKPLPKHGRGSADKQYFFINGRPCDHEKLSKTINSCYRMFEKFQYPICVLVITVDKNSVDVNVTPDKRILFLDNQQILVEALSQYLNGEFEKYAGVFLDQSHTVQLSLPAIMLPDKCVRPLLTNTSKLEHCLSYNSDNVLYDTGMSSKCTDISVAAPAHSHKVFEPTSCVKAVHLENSSMSKEAEHCGYLEKSFVEEVDRKQIPINRRNVSFRITLDELRRRLKSCRVAPMDDNHAAIHYNYRVVSSNDAEKELNKTISKPMFRKMKVLGQFNLGFILARLDNNLFIIDQHATDEKYRFEKLQKETKLENQKLIHPKLLSLNGAQEDLLISYKNIFERNGFDFLINYEADPGKRVSLSSLPRSRNWEFDESDVEELLWLLSGETTIKLEHLRPSKVQRMFATRACRSAVMIGTALNRSEMRKIVDHMSDMDHPWNCPHGRPTMRHVVELSRIRI